MLTFEFPTEKNKSPRRTTHFVQKCTRY